MGANHTTGSRDAADPRVAPYGSWRSPITAALIAEAGMSIGWLQAGERHVFWVECRPVEDGRYVIVRTALGSGPAADVTPAGFSARSLVHEYGGGMYALHSDTVYFSNLDDQRIYRQDLSGAGAAVGGAAEPQAITPAPPRPRGERYADGRVTPDGRRLICVRERHGHDRVDNELVCVLTDGSGVEQVIASGHDFYSTPRISPDGTRLAWISWDHPLMPWDGTELWVAELAAGGELRYPQLVAGSATESVVQPAWSPDGRLHFVSDRTGWWNVYRAADRPAAAPEPLLPMAAEFAKPHWVFGPRNYDFLTDGRIACFFTEDGVDGLGIISAPAGANPGALQRLSSGYTAIDDVTVAGGRIWIIGADATDGPGVVAIDPADGTAEVVRRSHTYTIDPGYISPPLPVEFPTDGGVTAHAFHYAPANRDFCGPQGERPPLIVISHGGPTSAHDACFDPDIQYWTSRGFAVVDVNYGGSSGFGRAYRERLRGQWGVIDTVDCINAAKYLVARDDADPARLAVRGASAGGYTTLNALTRHRFFTAGASYFGLADLEMFVTGGTHKFEERYLIGLVGPYPEASAVYRERSPIHHVDRIECPVIVFQGLEDAIVPPRQAELIVAALRKKRLPYAYLAFEGEQHGFRIAKNIIRSLEAELSFYGRVFGFKPADEIAPLEIENLPA
jgi:dipeptidyl aminopeptidase/acylaminoacyl peptidase